MSDLNFQLTRRQQEILLKGLRFVRSHAALNMEEYTEEVAAGRQRQYAEIQQIESMLNEVKIVETAGV